MCPTGSLPDTLHGRRGKGLSLGEGGGNSKEVKCAYMYGEYTICPIHMHHKLFTSYMCNNICNVLS